MCDYYSLISIIDPCLLTLVWIFCSLQAYIREQIVQSVAIIHKRLKLDCDKSAPSSEDPLFTDIARLIHTGSQSSVSHITLINVAI